VNVQSIESVGGLRALIGAKRDRSLAETAHAYSVRGLKGPEWPLERWAGENAQRIRALVRTHADVDHVDLWMDQTKKCSGPEQHALDALLRLHLLSLVSRDLMWYVSAGLLPPSSDAALRQNIEIACDMLKNDMAALGEAFRPCTALHSVASSAA
jgi:hypothetical protein